MPVKAKDMSGGSTGDACRNAFDIIPSDTDELPFIPRRIWVGYIGDIHLETASGDDVTLYGVGVGWIDWVRVRKVWASGTTADDLVGWY